MKSLVLILCFLGFSLSALVLPLEWYNSTTPTLISNVLDGSKLYLSSSDHAAYLAKITVVSNGQSRLLNTLLADFDASGFLNGFPVNSDLTISTTNSQAITQELNGILFISSPEMAKDSNFLVYSVSDQVKTIDRSTAPETTLVFLCPRITKAAADPAIKPYYTTRIYDIDQSKGSMLYMYAGTPTDGYTDPTFKETFQKQILKNPISLLPTGETVDQVFFDNIEPLQFTLRSSHVRIMGGGITLTVSREWVDQTSYQTTKETTTGFTMSQRGTSSSNVMYKYTPGQHAMNGYTITTTELFADVNVTTCSGNDCQSEQFSKNMVVLNDFFQFARNDTMLAIDIEKNIDYGVYYFQYFRTEENVYLNNNFSTTSNWNQVTSTQFPDTTTKSVATLSTIIAIVTVLLNLL